MIYLIFLFYLLVTIIIEGTAIFAVFRRKIYVYYSVLCNVLTNPAMNLVLLIAVNTFGYSVYFPVLAVSEIAVIFTESFVYNYLCRFGVLKSVALSLALNSLSCLAGIIINWLN